MSEAALSHRAYASLLERLRQAELLSSVSNVLSWDQETMLPLAGTALRADQMALLSGMVHQRRTDPEVGELLAACEADPELAADPRAAANLREIRREYDRAVLIPSRLVQEVAQTTTLAQQAWREARERSDFPSFAPWLDRVCGLMSETAEALGGTTPEERYDLLMEGYEPGARSRDLEATFSGLRRELAPLIADIARSGRRPDDRIQRIEVDVQRQAAFCATVARAVGFDFGAGRLDVSTHPFCQGVGPGDTRLTTRYGTARFPDALSSTLHEVGHGLYEQGLPKREYPGQPLSEAASLGMHESQSRLWENMVGRSRGFWEWALPELKRSFSPDWPEMDVEEAYLAVNRVEPNLIRVDSDEATYNLHIMLRFDLERALLSGDLSIADLPAAWNDRMRQDLGLEVPDDRRGVLQDIHWSMGALGYFPTYTLGNLYAGQIWQTLLGDISDLPDRISRGEFQELLAWLRERVHAHGRRYPAAELCERVTGRPLEAEPFLRYLREKLASIYALPPS